MIGTDWDKYIVCEGCGNRPTQCSCKKDDIKIAFQMVGFLIILATIVSMIVYFVL